MSLLFCAYALNKQENVDDSNITEIIRKNGYVYATSTDIQIAKFEQLMRFTE